MTKRSGESTFETMVSERMDAAVEAAKLDLGPDNRQQKLRFRPEYLPTQGKAVGMTPFWECLMRMFNDNKPIQAPTIKGPPAWIEDENPSPGWNWHLDGWTMNFDAHSDGPSYFRWIHGNETFLLECNGLRFYCPSVDPCEDPEDLNYDDQRPGWPGNP